MNRRFAALFLGIVVSLLSFSNVTQAQNIEGIFQAASRSLFDGPIGSLTSSAGAPSAEPAKTEFRETNLSLRDITVEARNAFEKTYAEKVSSLENLEVGYKQAVSNAAAIISAKKQQAFPASQQARAALFLNEFEKQLLAEASSGEYIKSYLTGQAISQGSQQNAENTRAAARGVAPSTVGKNNCSLLSWSVVSCIDEGFAWFIKSTLLSYATIFTWLFGMMFHFSIYYGVLNFHTFVGTQDTSALYGLWELIRGVTNIIVTFFILSAAFLYAIDKGDPIKRYIPFVLIYVLLVNFSWWGTRLAVDYSNIATLKLYQAIAPGALKDSFSLSGTSAATQIMNELGMQTVITKITSSNTGTQTNADFSDQIRSTPAALLFVVMAAYLAYVFLFSAVIFALRTVLLTLFIVFSPLLLLDIALPGIGEQLRKARAIFFSQLALGVVFMLMLYVVVTAMTQFNIGIKALNEKNGVSNVSTSAYASAASGSAEVQQFFGVLIMLILLFVMMKLVKSLSFDIGGMVGKAVGTGIMLASGGVGIAARATLGAASSRIAGSAALDRMQGSISGRMLKSGFDTLANSSYDFRAVKPIQGFAQKEGVRMGAPIKNYNSAFADYSDKVEKTAASIKDAEARKKFLQKQAAGPLGIQGRIDRAITGTKLEGLRSDRARAVDARAVKQYNESIGAERQKLFKEASLFAQNKIKDQDRSEAEKSDEAKSEGIRKELASYEDKTNTAKQKVYDNASGYMKEQMREQDRQEAIKEAEARSSSKEEKELLREQIKKQVEGNDLLKTILQANSAAKTNNQTSGAEQSSTQQATNNASSGSAQTSPDGVVDISKPKTPRVAANDENPTPPTGGAPAARVSNSSSATMADSKIADAVRKAA